MNLLKTLRNRTVVITVVLLTILVAAPSGAAIAGVGAADEDALFDQMALEELERLHSLPETLDLIPPAPWVSESVVKAAEGYGLEPVDGNPVFMSQPSPMAATGTAKVASLAIEFTDVTHRSANTISKMKGYLTGSNSMKSYYEEVSWDKLTVDGEAYGWYTAENDMAYYGAPEGGSSDSRHFSELIREAVLAANPYVDFSQYDTDRNGVIDSLCMVHAGRDEATGGGSNAIWSKQSVYPGTLRVDGVYVGYYFTVSEDSPVGVYVHEFGHMLGLPDLYDTDYSSYGVGMWDVMASGAWGGGGRTPTHPSAWSKVYLGWITPTTINNYVEGRSLKYIEGVEGEILKLPTTDSQQYFLLENRLATAYDRYLPTSGLLIWHIDQTVINSWMRYNRVNNDENHKGVDLEEASSEQQLDRRIGGNDGDSSDVWRSSTEGFNKDSSPDSGLYDGTVTKISVFNISAAGETMTIDIDFGGDSYAVFLDTLSPINEAAPGEKITYNITVGTRSALGDTIDLTLTGTHKAWGYLDTSSLNLGPKGYALVKMEVTPPPGTPKDVQGQVSLKAESRTVQGIFFTLETFTVVKQMHLLEAVPSSKTVYVEPGTPKHLDISVTNRGNGRENLTLSLDADRSYWGSITPTEVSVGVGDSINLRVTFDLPQGILAGEEEPFDLVFFSEVLGGGFEGDETTSLVPTMHIPLQMVVDEIVSLRWGNIQDDNIMPGESLHYELTLYNEGNSNSSVLLGYQGPEGWLLDIDDGDSFSLPAFGARTFNATLTAPDDVLADTSVRLDLSAAVGTHFFPGLMRVSVDQLFAVRVDGQEARFADPGERATFNLTVTNLGNGNDRVIVQVEANGGLWAVSTDQNFVDLGTKVEARAIEMHVFVTAPANAEAFEEKTLAIDFVSENGILSATHEVTLTVNPISDFSVETEVLTDTIDLRNPARRTATYLIYVKNTGNQEDLFHIGLLDLPDGWTSIFESRMISVPAQKQKTVEFTIIPPAGDVPILAGTIEFKVHVASELGNGLPSLSNLEVTVGANRGHTLSTLEPAYKAISGSKLTFRVLVINEGNVPETVILSAVGSYESVSFEAIELALQPFGQRVVNVTVEMPSTKEDTTVDLQIIATTKDQTKQVHIQVPVEVEGRSGVPGPTAIAALVGLFIVGVVSIASARRRSQR